MDNINVLGLHSLTEAVEKLAEAQVKVAEIEAHGRVMAALIAKDTRFNSPSYDHANVLAELATQADDALGFGAQILR